MKKVISGIFFAITSLMVFAVGGAFSFIEGRLLFSAELNTYAVTGFAYFSTIVKFVLAVLAIASAIIPWIAKRTSYGSGLRTFTYTMLYALVIFSVIFAFRVNMGSSKTILTIAQIGLFTMVPILHAISGNFFLVGD